MEVLYEEDFAFLDSTDDEDDFKENKVLRSPCIGSLSWTSCIYRESFVFFTYNKTKCIIVYQHLHILMACFCFSHLRKIANLELPKEWPIDVHERPEYNYKTQQIESFDFTIREIQKKVPPKKPRLETVPIRRKSNKKYLSRKKKPKAVVEKKTPLKDLQPLVKSTNALLRDFFRSLRDDRHLIKRDKNNLHERVQILRNQAMLSSLVNGDQVDEALKNLDRCFKE
ncbi:unnamed protein product [Acanthoscelides obtectus]|uniref:Uncharacterized protein n=1 Tax=Acanthoscelides obtectus TaxID=200917 RepID=A0A9P0VQ85_ACAOB|nr:unnamed protein product [Acanthoscelides obtectus]CAK1689386.1 hypothetical protein AOBTE_LOCUS37214 [Acanthoscelides obtectus]